MKVNGSVKPDNFVLEDDPDDSTLARAIFRENITSSKNENSEGIYDYDEYVLPIKKETELANKITSNYDFYLLAAKGRDSWLQMNNLLTNKIA